MNTVPYSWYLVVSREIVQFTFYCIVTTLHFVGLHSEGIDMERCIKAQIIKGYGQRTVINPLTPNDPYRGRTASLTSKVAFYIFIQQI